MKKRRTPKLLAIALALSCMGQLSFAQGADDQRAFSIPERTDALGRAREAKGHVAARRWPQAVQVLQDMLEHDGDAVLPDSYRAGSTSRSIHNAFPGAGQWALEQLLKLPAEATQVYRQRFGSAAEDALAIASSSQDQAKLIETATRWPLCDAASHALWILGELELEAGHLELALLAWRQALETIELLQPELDGQPNPRIKALHKRCALISARLHEKREAAGLKPLRHSKTQAAGDPLVKGDQSLARRSLPSEYADAWYTFIDMWPFERSGASKVLYPTEHRGRVLVSNSRELYCLDAFSGRELWRTEPPWGWDLLGDKDKTSLLAGSYPEMLQIQPVASGRVAVAALQLPFSSLPNVFYGDMTVMTSIPQRRLFAFDLDSGAPLWNHAPELEIEKRTIRSTTLQLKSLDRYAEGMMIAATPTIVGSRLLVPSYILEGRIDYQVACYELESGRLLWKTNLISGQRGRNMFGRAMREFCSSPLVVEGQRVIAQTDLGAIAALDLNTGTILWESLYRQIEQPQKRGYRPVERQLTWLTSKPIVIGDCVISAPADSRELYCYDLRDGRSIWSYTATSLSKLTPFNRYTFDRLLGADGNTIYLGGDVVAALTKSGGLDGIGPLRPLWAKLVSNSNYLPPQLLCEQGILVPQKDERVVYSRNDGNRVASLSAKWVSPGTPAITDGILFTLGRDGVRGYFDWPVLLAKQEREYRSNPDNYEIGLASAQLFARRAEASLKENELFTSLKYLKQAREILEGMDDQSGVAPRTSALLHRVLRGEALSFERKGDRSRALTRLARARALAPHPRDLRDTLLQEERILRSSSKRDAYLAILDTLEAECALQPLPKSFLAEPSAALELDDSYKGRMPSIALWVLLQRAQENSQAGNLAAAFDDWSRVLVRFDEFELQDQSASELSARRMQQQLRRPAGRRAYTAFEERAQGLLELAAQSKDLAALDRLTKAYPHSDAARRSDQIQIEWAYEQGDRQRLANIVNGPRASELENGGRDAHLRLARLLGQAGNGAYERGLIGSIIRDSPGATSSLPERNGRPLMSVLDDLLAHVPAKPERMPRFRGEISARRVVPGRHTFLGSMDAKPGPSGSQDELHIYALEPPIDRSAPPQGLSRPSAMGIKNPLNLLSFTESDSERSNWHIVVQDEFHNASLAAEACVTSGERAVVGGRLGIHAYDSEGQLVWEHPRREQQLDAQYLTRSLSLEAGVLVAWMQDRDNSGACIARAFDVQLGTLLWEAPLEQANRNWRKPIISSKYVVFLSKPYGRPLSVQAINLFSGERFPEYELGKITGSTERVAWIDGDRLMLPSFGVGSDQSDSIQVHDLTNGNKLASQTLPSDEELLNVVRWGAEIFIVMGSSRPGKAGGVYRFNRNARSPRRILPLRTGERPLGMRTPGSSPGLVELKSPELFLFTSDDTLGLRVRALDLDQARITWSKSLAVESRSTSLPVVSDSHVAIVAKSKVNRRNIASLFLLDLSNGLQTQRIDLNSQLANSNFLRLQGLGQSIYIAGSGTLTNSRRLEVINTSEDTR